MRKILEIWQKVLHDILATVKENKTEKAISNVLGVQINNNGNPYRPQSMGVASIIEKFKRTSKRFKDQEDKYLIFPKCFLENLIYDPIQTLRLGNVTPEGLTYLPLGSGILEDIKVEKRLGKNAKYKTFKQVAKEQNLRWGVEQKSYGLLLLSS